MLSWLWNLFFKDSEKESLKEELSSLKVLLEETKEKLSDAEKAFKELCAKEAEKESYNLELEALLDEKDLEIQRLKSKLPQGVI